MTQGELKVELERRRLKKQKHYKKAKSFGKVGGKIAGSGALVSAAMGGCDPTDLKKSPACLALGIGAGTGAAVAGVGAGFSGAGYLQKRKTKKIQKLLDKQAAVASRGRKRRKKSKAYHAKQYKKARKYQRRKKTASRKKKSYRRKNTKKKNSRK